MSSPDNTQAHLAIHRDELAHQLDTAMINRDAYMIDVKKDLELYLRALRNVAQLGRRKPIVVDDWNVLVNYVAKNMLRIRCGNSSADKSWIDSGMRRSPKLHKHIGDQIDFLTQGNYYADAWVRLRSALMDDPDYTIQSPVVISLEVVRNFQHWIKQVTP